MKRLDFLQTAGFYTFSLGHILPITAVVTVILVVGTGGNVLEFRESVCKGDFDWVLEFLFIKVVVHFLLLTHMLVLSGIEKTQCRRCNTHFGAFRHARHFSAVVMHPVL